MNISEMTNKEYSEFRAILNNRFRHTQRRIRERFGLYLNITEYFQLISAIVDKNSVMLYKNKYVEFHCLYYKSNNIIFVYEPKTQSIRTALTLEHFE